MKIEVIIDELEIGQKLSRIVVDFDNGAPKTTIQTTPKSKTKSEEPAQAIDFSTLGDIKVSQEIVEKPKVPETKDRKISVAAGMQNLKI